MAKEVVQQRGLAIHRHRGEGVGGVTLVEHGHDEGGTSRFVAHDGGVLHAKGSHDLLGPVARIHGVLHRRARAEPLPASGEQGADSDDRRDEGNIAGEAPAHSDHVVLLRLRRTSHVDDRSRVRRPLQSSGWGSRDSGWCS